MKKITMSTMPSVRMECKDGARCNFMASPLRPCSRSRLNSNRPIAAKGPIRLKPAVSGKTSCSRLDLKTTLNRMRPMIG